MSTPQSLPRRGTGRLQILLAGPSSPSRVVADLDAARRVRQAFRELERRGFVAE